MATSTVPHIDVYVKELGNLMFGYPLWHPDSPFKGPGVRIGDVGFVRRGAFHRMFNALEDAHHPINRCSGVPEGHEPFASKSPETSYFVNRNAIKGGALHSKTVKQLSVTSNAASHQLGAGLSFRSTADKAAVLFMKHGAIEEGVLDSESLRQYFLKNAGRWVHFITKVLGNDIPTSSGLMFVTGTYKTPDWAVAAYATSGKSATFQLNADMYAASCAFSVSSTSERDVAPMQNWGPSRPASLPGDHSSNSSGSVTHSEKQYDYCVFFNHYSYKERLLFPNVIKAGAGYDELPRPDSDDETDNPIVSVTSDRDTEESANIATNATATNDWDPVGCLLDYILNETPDAKTAIASDRDVRELYARYSECNTAVDIESLVETVKPRITILDDMVGYINHDDNASGKDMTIVDHPTPLISHNSIPLRGADGELEGAQSSKQKRPLSDERSTPYQATLSRDDASSVNVAGSDRMTWRPLDSYSDHPIATTSAPTRQEVERHVDEPYYPSEQFICGRCGAAFTMKRAFERHMRSVHK